MHHQKPEEAALENLCRLILWFFLFRRVVVLYAAREAPDAHALSETFLIPPAFGAPTSVHLVVTVIRVVVG